MIELLPIPPDHVIGVRMAGKLEKADIDKTVQAIEAKLTVHDQVSIYAEIASFEGITLDALVADLKFAFPHLRDFAKKAEPCIRYEAHSLGRCCNCEAFVFAW